uniref:UPAR/Ly6 domain-containing protein n=1 Tax=Panagrolaimus sp. ES5 TaxID=591445 RepID=A0AC34GQB5_9BILA
MSFERTTFWVTFLEQHHFKTMHSLTVLVVLGLMPIVSSKITCYRGINIIMPGNANFNQSMASLGCNNADFCLRAFGTFNGQDGWFSTCASSDTCTTYPACTQTTTTGVAGHETNYTSCCCKKDLCNEMSFTGDPANTTTPVATSQNPATSQLPTTSPSIGSSQSMGTSFSSSVSVSPTTSSATVSGTGSTVTGSSSASPASQSPPTVQPTTSTAVIPTISSNLVLSFFFTFIIFIN